MSAILCRHLITNRNIMNRNIMNRNIMNLGILFMNTIPISRRQGRRAAPSRMNTHTATPEG